MSALSWLKCYTWWLSLAARRVPKGGYHSPSAVMTQLPGAGETCSDDLPMCSERHHCVGSTCVPRAQVLADCPPEAGDSCHVSADEICTPTGDTTECAVVYGMFVGLGETCTPDPEPGLMTRTCLLELICDESTNICVERKAEGVACSWRGECAVGLDCSMDTMTCVPYPTLAEPCSSRCLDPYVCLVGTCAAKKPAGEQCLIPHECESFRCGTNDTCLEPCP